MYYYKMPFSNLLILYYGLYFYYTILSIFLPYPCYNIYILVLLPINHPKLNLSTRNHLSKITAYIYLCIYFPIISILLHTIFISYLLTIHQIIHILIIIN